VTTLFSSAHANSSVAQDLERYQAYKAISALAVASLGMGILSVLTFVQWVFGMVPLVGIVLGLLALRQVRTRAHELTGLPLALGGIILSATLLPAGWAWLYYVYATEVPPGHVRINYDLLKPASNDEPFPPPSALQLDGQKVFLKGYMFPSNKQQNLKEFTLCRDNAECCFGGQPKPWDMVRVVMKDPPHADYTTWQRKVAGVLKVKVPDFSQPIQEGGVDHHLFFYIETDHLQ
jgi:hypothetical protein